MTPADLLKSIFHKAWLNARLPPILIQVADGPVLDVAYMRGLVQHADARPKETRSKHADAIDDVVSRLNERNTVVNEAGKSMSIKEDVAVHCSSGKRWASLPSKPLIDDRKGDNGKILYVPILEWLDSETADRFSEGLIEAVEHEYPGSTGV